MADLIGSSSGPRESNAHGYVRLYDGFHYEGNWRSMGPGDVLPMSKGAFMRDCFRKCAVYCRARKGAGSDRHLQGLKGAMGGLDVREIYEGTSSDNVFVWLVEDGRKIRSIDVEDAAAAVKLYEEGHATYCRANDDVEQHLVANFLGGLGIGCGQYDVAGIGRGGVEGRGEVEVFAGSAGHYTDW